MKKDKYLSYIFVAFAILLTNVMCATVAYQYCDMQWGILYKGYSAPASIVFLFAIPYAIGIVICTILAWFFYKKHQKFM